MKTVRIWSIVLLLIFSAGMLTACGKKPPECADSAASDALRRSMNALIVEALPSKGVDPKNDKNGIIAKYLSSWTFGVANVTSGGYDEKSHTRSCAGRVTITIPDTQQTGYVDVQYTMQLLEDAKSGDFQLMYSKNFERWAYDAVGPVATFYQNSVTAGTWSGVSQCGPTQMRTALPDDQGYTIVSTAGTWTPDGSPEPTVELSISGGKAVMNISAGAKSTTRTTDVSSSGSIVFSSKDEFESLVTDHLSIADGEIAPPDARMPNVRMRAKVKTSVTGDLLDVLVERLCTLKMTKK